MKRSNVKVGQFIEAKVTVLPYHIAGESYEVVRVEPRHYGGDLDCRIQTKGEEGQPFKKWVSSTDFRKPRTKAPTAPVAPVLTEECTTQNLQVGDTVIVGAEGAGYGQVLPAYAGLTCVVTRLTGDTSVYIQHPDVYLGKEYRSWLKYLTKVVKEPVVEPVVQEKLPPTYIQVGDYILSSGRDPELEADTLYKVVKVNPRHIDIALHTSSSEAWQKCYCLTMSDYSKVLREVQPDAEIK